MKSVLPQRVVLVSLQRPLQDRVHWRLIQSAASPGKGYPESRSRLKVTVTVTERCPKKATRLLSDGSIQVQRPIRYNM